MALLTHVTTAGWTLEVTQEQIGHVVVALYEDPALRPILGFAKDDPIFAEDGDDPSPIVEQAVMRHLSDPASIPIQTILHAFEDEHPGIRRTRHSPDITAILTSTGIHAGLLMAFGLMDMDIISVRNGTRWWQFAALTICPPGKDRFISTMANMTDFSLDVDIATAETFIGIVDDLPETLAHAAAGLPLRAVLSSPLLDERDLVIDRIVQQDGHVGRIYVRGFTPMTRLIPSMETTA